MPSNSADSEALPKNSPAPSADSAEILPTVESIGLALSGGGFRAMLYHIGVLRCLADANLLRRVKYITSVSGGSILAAHVVNHWEDFISGPEGFEKASQKLFELAEYDIRGRIVRRLPFSLWPLSATELFESYLRRQLFGASLLKNLKKPGRPKLYILATNSTRGCQASFMEDKIEFDPENGIPPNQCRLSVSVTASAAFPGFFKPLKLTRSRVGADQKHMPITEFIMDGGIWDNLGFHRLTALNKATPVSLRIVSNARAPFDWAVQKRPSVLRDVLRTTDILMERIRVLEREHADSVDRCDDRLKMVNIEDVASGDDTLPDGVQEGLARIRTDFDCFRVSEINWLVCHGYEIARKVLQLPPTNKCWWPIGTRPSRDQELAREAIDVASLTQISCVRKIRLFSSKDWYCWFMLALLAIVIILIAAWRFW